MKRIAIKILVGAGLAYAAFGIYIGFQTMVRLVGHTHAPSTSFAATASAITNAVTSAQNEAFEMGFMIGYVAMGQEWPDTEARSIIGLYKSNRLDEINTLVTRHRTEFHTRSRPEATAAIAGDVHTP